MFGFLSKTLYRRLLTRIEAIEEAQEAQYDRFKRKEATEFMRESRATKRQTELEFEAAKVLAAVQQPAGDSSAQGSKVALFQQANKGRMKP